MNQNLLRSYDFLWLSLALLFLLPIAFFLSITPHDYWFYVRMGADIVQTRSVLTVDTFSYTYAGTPLFDQAWLSAVIFWFAHSFGGATLTYLLRGLCIASAYGIAWSLMREGGTGPKLATLLTILLGFSSSMNWSMRPQMFAYPLFAVTLWVLWRWHRGQPRWMWTLPMAALLWANLHGSFVLIYILLGSALVFGAGDRKQLAIWSGLSFLAAFINPGGYLVWRYVADMFSSPSVQLYAAEWHPPVNAGWQMNIFFLWILLFIPLVAFSPRRLSLLEWFWFLGFGWLALSGLRYVIWFMFIMAIISGPLLTDLLRLFKPESTTENPNSNFNWVLGCLVLLMPFMMLPGLREGWWKDSPPPYHALTTPSAAALWLEAHPELPGPLFAEYTFGSYLTFALPSRPVWIDNRFHVYPPEHWEKYQTISSGKPGWAKLMEADKVNLLMLSPLSQPTLVEVVEASDQWCEQYRDEVAVIFSRCEPIP